MINERDVEVISTLQGEKIPMKIADDALVHIMSLLTEAYEDAELAIIREYSTNALDAHVEAGVTKPIEVTVTDSNFIIPSEMFLKVRDYGNGLSIQDIHNIYSQYGKTTKNESNDYVGSLGIGCKSALAYTSQFTFTSVKDGVRCQVIVSKDEDNAASMTVIDTSVTDDPSGVEIVVPLKRFNGVSQKAKEFFRYWEKGTVLLNGEAPILIEGLKVSQNLLLVPGANDHRVVMGNIPYPARFSSHELGLPDGYSIVAFVDIGDVHFTPSRESLKVDSRKTKETLARVGQEVVSELPAAIQRDIDASADNYEALAKSVHWNKVAAKALRSTDITYNGVPVPDKVDTESLERALVTSGGHKRLSVYEKFSSINASYIPNSIFIYGYDKPKFSAYTKHKMHKYCEDNKIEYPKHFVLTPSKMDTTWISESSMVDFEEIRQIKLPRLGGGGSPRRTTKGTYDCYVNGDYHEGYPADQINTKKPVYYHEGTSPSPNYDSILTENVGKHTLVSMWANRTNKFKRDFPMAQEARTACLAFYNAWKATISEDDMTALYIQSFRGHLGHLEADRIDDLELSQAVAFANKDLSTFKDKIKIYNCMGGANLYGRTWKNPLDSYPLVANSTHYLNSSFKEDVYIYINAAYNARKALNGKQA